MTAIPYSTNAHSRATNPTIRSIPTTPTVVDRLLIGTGTAIAAWGVRRAERRSSPAYAEQTAAFESRRDTAARDLPMLPR
jgi:hypothetical protein